MTFVGVNECKNSFKAAVGNRARQVQSVSLNYPRNTQTRLVIPIILVLVSGCENDALKLQLSFKIVWEGRGEPSTSPFL